MLSDEQVAELKKLASPAEQAEEAAKAEKREYMKQKQRECRERKVIKEVAEQCATIDEWWAAMRKSLGLERREELEAIDREARDYIILMTDGWRIAPNEDGFVKPSVLLKWIDSFVEEHGLVHDYWFDSEHLKEMLSFKVWTDESHAKSKALGKPKPFWWDPPRLKALCEEEGQATRDFALYGYYTGLPQQMWHFFKQNIKNHAAERKCCYPPECWSCKFEKAHRIATPTAL